MRAKVGAIVKERGMELKTNCIFFLLFSFLFSLLSVFHYSICSTRKRNPKQLPPGPKGQFLVGNLLEIGHKPHQSLAKLADSYGPIMSLKLGQITSIVVSSPAMAKEVLQSHDQVLSDRAFPDATTVYDHHKVAIPWLPVCDLWRTLRKTCNNLMFSHQILDSKHAIRQKSIQRLLADVRESAVKSEVVDIGKAVFATTLNTLSNMIFSIDLSGEYFDGAWGEDFKEIVWSVMEEAGRSNVGDFFPTLKKMDLQGCRRRMTVHMKRFLDIIDEMIEEKRKEPKLGEQNDMLQNLLDLAKQSEDVDFETHLIKHLILVLFSAGTDTTTSTVEWAMAELLRNPQILSKAKAELKQVIGEHNLVGEADFSRLPFLKAIVKETLRLHPPGPLLLPRKARESTEIIGGFVIPKDAQVIVNAWKIGRDKSAWKDDVDLFKPERFLGLSEEVDYKGRNFELIPFGSGRRICPGMSLATKMVHWILGSLIHSFDWRLEDEITPETLDMDEKVGLTLSMAHPLRAIPLIVS